MEEKWNEHLFTCYKDMYSCAIISIFPPACCIYQGLAVNRSSGESFLSAFCLSFLFLCIGGAMNRGKIRDKYLIKGTFINDCAIHLFCTICAVSQEYREIIARKKYGAMMELIE